MQKKSISIEFENWSLRRQFENAMQLKTWIFQNFKPIKDESLRIFSGKFELSDDDQLTGTWIVDIRRASGEDRVPCIPKDSTQFRKQIHSGCQVFSEAGPKFTERFESTHFELESKARNWIWT
jgi:hypothetical protein